MEAALKLKPVAEDLAQLSRKPPLGKKRNDLKLIWENPGLSAGKQREKPEVELRLVSGQTLYSYVGGNPVMGTDPLGLFQFGTRPLNGLPRSMSLGNNNIGLLHENGFYDNGGDVGFFPEGIRSDVPGQLNNYSREGPFYDDSIMQQAEQNLRNSGNWLPDDPGEPWYSNANPNDYDLTLNNCQDFADALREEYRRLGGATSRTPCLGGVCGTGL